ncbi:hypothetical protein [uncultured Parabacteroides sp.]|uniref:hypothetical protein n=1 Tax=uncultured Parabacteroides sp. TaxID=512312 RepID=UPI0028039903|nr:hypothetical protein [uncultured Parabacteroides sp.]
MKKVNFMKLNLQQENILSKEERKEALGGGAPYPCYARCGGYTVPVPACSQASYYCEGNRVECCTCQASSC